MGIPVDRYLVPDALPVAPAGFTSVLHPLQRSLPEELRLDAEFSLIVQAPTGAATLWRDADGSALVDASDDDALPGMSPAPPLARVPARLVLRRRGAFVGAVPLVLGIRRQLPDADSLPVALEIVVLGFRLHVGTLREAGDFGSFVHVAWRRREVASDEFRLPALPSRVAARFSAQVQSQVGERAGEEASRA